MNKRKIINDPVYGFITIPTDLLYDLIQHPYVQRLRRIRQLGLTDLVYPGALHTRFHHALGAMHLMGEALENLRRKGTLIWDVEREAAQAAILLHDVGHGPFSHVLERSVLQGVPHERVSRLIMNHLNQHFGGALDLAVQMFSGTYERPFFHQLISSQLDVDRLDYLKRDCYFTGVLEGSIGASRILKMLAVHNGELVVEEKGIYTIESFLNARRVMYWQVYLHKATVAAEQMMVQVIRRARELSGTGEKLFASPPLRCFLGEQVTWQQLTEPAYLEAFTCLDDYDLWTSIKVWAEHDDPLLSWLSRSLRDRQLFRVRLSNEPFAPELIAELREKTRQELDFTGGELDYVVPHGSVRNAAYMPSASSIKVLTKAGGVVDIVEASDLPNLRGFGQVVEKHFVCWPREVPPHVPTAPALPPAPQETSGRLWEE
ncbi:MAG: HD domain-containing protein [Catalinimonas sp.]